LLRKPVSIRVKFVLAVSLAILAAQAVVASAFVWRDTGLYARTKQETLYAAAQSIAAAAAEPARRRDVDGAYRALRAIGAIPGASYVRLEDMNGEALAETGRTEQLVGDAIQSEPGREIDRFQLLGSRTLEIVAPVIDAGQTVGRLVLVGDVSDLPQRLADALALMAWGALGALVVAIAIAGRMLGRMTRPLADLAGAMTHVGASHDYNVTMKSTRGDEIGVLVRGFDKMLGEIRQRNADLAAHRDRLEIEVADRTADYRRAMELAEDANRSKSDFLATMSHEIRTPMNGVLVMAEMLAASELPPRARKNADVIVRSGQTLLAIINDILDFSKIEAGKLDVETLSVDPVEAAEDVLRLFGDRAQSKGLDLADLVRLPRGVHVDADPVRLAQVLSNLVNNALKFTETGGVTLRIENDPDDFGRVRFSVVDTGIGIPEDKLDGIFGAFTQADQSTTRKFGGTGLGLAIARKLVAAMGGDLRVSSAAGQGATFFFSLPMTAGCNHADGPRLAAPARAVVCVEGEGSRAHLAFALASAGFEAEICGADRIGECARGARLVFVDLDSLPNAGRLDVAPNAAIVAISGLGEAPDRLLADGRVDRIVQRPLAGSETRSIVDAVVEGRSVAVAQQAAARSELPRFPNARVLVVDDAAVNREVASEALKRLGIIADLANDGRQAVDAVEARTYDLVLMDGSMPELDGYEATLAIRARENETGRARLKIVALTAHVVGAAASAWRDAGMDGVLHKPFTLSALAHCLAEHLESAAASVAVEAEPSDEPADADDVNPKIIAGLREMSGGDNTAVIRIVALYCAHAPQSLAAIKAAFETGDTKALGAAAHALKSMSANIGAVAVYGAAQAIERACRLDNRLPEEELIAKLPAMLETASAEVRRLAGEGGAAAARSA
jgi:two-component system sensor histidine kinase BarA